MSTRWNVRTFLWGESFPREECFKGVSDLPGVMDKKNNPDSTDFHAIIPINNYPQKARWRLIDMTGASVTNKGIYYDQGKEPPLEGPPKLHLLVESNEDLNKLVN
ncbi:hypothetical protein DFJ43DRAFT_1040836 [Lentinula guzmanii]|uniref:Uncharacterized protein n=1 Tax=Lentinula guzmanii TaxID=2804957 RepID=A0AA38JGK6_9AGAR|nr:hypothetical protein DFJ43DRAFT_1040836 [Lentinula guzmanii]